MAFIEILALTLVIFGVIVGVYFLIANSGVATSQKRRLQALRYRHSDSTDAKVESQFKKAIAARKPKTYKVAGSGSQLDALIMRLDRTGRDITISQYVYASIGLALAVAVLVYLQSGAAALSLGIGLLIGAGVPHLVVGYMISKRTANFNAKFPDGIELLVRGLRSGLPVTETLSVVAEEVPGPVGTEFKGIVERIKIGKTMEDSLQETADRLAIPEFNFFAITEPTKITSKPKSFGPAGWFSAAM
ncbi:MAG: type II secretion system F family protein, partial [Pseudomonadota bacterium]